MSTPTKKTCCPTCFYVFDYCSVLFTDEAIAPAECDPTLCLNCGRVLIFHSGLATPATTAEIRELMSDCPDTWHKIEQAQAAITIRGRFFKL